MSNARSTPPSRSFDATPPQRSKSSRPPRSIARLDEALADAEKMARRVDRVLEEDPFAAALLAREYLSLVQEREVNPLNQQGHTDAWTSAFVRLRVASNTLDRDSRRADGEAYLVARAEERRLFAMFGNAPKSRLAAARAEARAKRRQKRGFRVAAIVAIVAAAGASAVAFALGYLVVAVAAAAGGVVLAAITFAASRLAARAFVVATNRAAELERGISAFAQFETSENGRRLLQRIRQEHPLLVRTSLNEGSSAPPPPNSGERPIVP